MEFNKVHWGYLIEPAYAWTESFADRFDSPDIRIYGDYEDSKPNVYVWSSVHLNEHQNDQKRHDQAIALNALFDGAMYVYRGRNYAPFWRGSLQNLDTGVNLYKEPGGFDPAPFWSDYVTASPAWPDHEAATYIYLARSDEAAKEILLFLGTNGPTWISLYAILDTMKFYGWGEKDMINSGAATEKELDLFGHTANNPAAIGPLARHGSKKGWTPPANPMSLAEAQTLVLKIAQKFLSARVALARTP